MAMAVCNKPGVAWINYDVNGHREWARIGPDKRLADTVRRKRKIEIAEGELDRGGIRTS